MGVTYTLELINPQFYQKALEIVPNQINGKQLSDISGLFKQFDKDFNEFCKHYCVELDLSTDMFSMNGILCYLAKIDSLELDKSLDLGFRKLFLTVKQLLPLKQLLIDLNKFDISIPDELMDEDGGLIGLWKASSLSNAQSVMEKYTDPNTLKDEINSQPESFFGKIQNSKKKQIEVLSIFNDEYYLDIWKEMNEFFKRAIKESHYVGFSIYL